MEGGAELVLHQASQLDSALRVSAFGRAAATAALRLTRGGRARGNESTVNIYGSYGVAYGGAHDPDAW